MVASPLCLFVCSICSNSSISKIEIDMYFPSPPPPTIYSEFVHLIFNLHCYLTQYKMNCLFLHLSIILQCTSFHFVLISTIIDSGFKLLIHTVNESSDICYVHQSFDNIPSPDMEAVKLFTYHHCHCHFWWLFGLTLLLTNHCYWYGCWFKLFDEMLERDEGHGQQ